MLLTILIYVSLALSFVYYLLKRNNNYWKSRGVPHDKPFLFLGSLYNVVVKGQSTYERLTEIYNNNKNQPYVGLYTFTKPILMIKNLDLTKRILVKDFDKFTNRSMAANEKADPIAFNTLFASVDKTWRNIRAKLSPVFTSGKIKMMLSLMTECGENLADVLKNSNNNVINVRALTKRYTVDIISSCAFGINANCLKNDNSEIFDAASKLTNQNSIIRTFSIMCFFFAPKLVDIFRLTFADKKSADYLINVFFTTLNEREQLNIQRNDLIDSLNQLKKSQVISDQFKFDDVKMAAQAIVFFSAGSDTTSVIISCTLYELALDKAIQNKLRNEIRESYKKHDGFTYESIQEMIYLDLVVSETLRKYPVTAFLDRKAADDYIVEETGFTIEKGTSIMIPACALHFDPEYFPNPHEFDPDRFSDENKSKIKAYTYLPFGEGPRNCIGQRFGLLSVKVGLIHALKDFEFDVTDKTRIPLKMVPTAILLDVVGGIPLKVNAL